MSYFTINNIDVGQKKYERQDVIIEFEDEDIKNAFFEKFENVFIEKILSPPALKILQNLKRSDIQISKAEIVYLKNNLTRIFKADQHYKGIIGEHLFAFICREFYNDVIHEQGPKGRSSAEPGIDYVTINGDISNYSSITLTVWETKTSEFNISSRGSEIYSFFEENGSMDQNIDSEVTLLLESLKDTNIDNLKKFMSEIFTIVINKDEKLNIGAAGVTATNNFTDQTFKGFEKTLGESLNKSQRKVKLVFIGDLNLLMKEVRNNIWELLLQKQP